MVLLEPHGRTFTQQHADVCTTQEIFLVRNIVLDIPITSKRFTQCSGAKTNGVVSVLDYGVQDLLIFM
jgi:hypothetical protein